MGTYKYAGDGLVLTLSYTEAAVVFAICRVLYNTPGLMVCIRAIYDEMLQQLPQECNFIKVVAHITAHTEIIHSDTRALPELDCIPSCSCVFSDGTCVLAVNMDTAHVLATFYGRATGPEVESYRKVAATAVHALWQHVNKTMRYRYITEHGKSIRFRKSEVLQVSAGGSSFRRWGVTL